MPKTFQIVTTPAFERDVRRCLRGAPNVIIALEEAQTVLRTDPNNRNQQHNIRKLTNVKKGEGQWRIRVGDYRLRYDIVGPEVVLYSFRHRREVYRR